ncbi:FtsK/SpoIIIE domain-containing protein [Microbacterium sp. BF1]|uniref:FtsK/SpoIIIE domain-containing protein n=1 Tax=Microbacterium sp. BF1 TaxID=2821146 RepID=UPI000D8F5F35|nr:FtsK/SpoIIIE domain-containing protein [Microbacterium sp. BF1]
MSYPRSVLREYWAGERPRLWHIGRWMLGIALVLTPFAFFAPAPRTVIALLAVAMVCIVVGRRLLAGRDMHAVLLRRWQTAMSAHIQAAWPELAHTLRLQIRTLDGLAIFAGLGAPRWEGMTLVASVALPRGLVREELVAASDRIAQAFSATRASVHGQQIGLLELHLEFVDALGQPFTAPLGGSWDGGSVAMGIAEGRREWRLRVGPHTLVAGSSGSGKASLVWGLLMGLVRPIHEGTVQVWGIDRKGGMELAMGRALLTRFADDAPLAVALLEDAVATMQTRARELAGHTRQHTASVDSPLVIILIDELAALTAYETDRDLLRRANAALATLASQGRAVGFVVFACLQDPRKETLPARGLFTQTIGLRLRDRTETAMVLGDGAVEGGARCHEISSATPGVAYVVPEDGTPPRRVRAAHVPDEQIRDAALSYFAPTQIPIVIPEAPLEPKRAPRTRQSRRSSDTQEES